MTISITILNENNAFFGGGAVGPLGPCGRSRKPCLRALGVVPPKAISACGVGGRGGATTPPEGSAPVAGGDPDSESRFSLRKREIETPFSYLKFSYLNSGV